METKKKKNNHPKKAEKLRRPERPVSSIPVGLTPPHFQRLSKAKTGKEITVKNKIKYNKITGPFGGETKQI